MIQVPRARASLLMGFALAACADRPAPEDTPIAPPPPVASGAPATAAPPPTPASTPARSAAPAPARSTHWPAHWLDQTLAPTVDRARLDGAPVYRLELELDDRLYAYRGRLRLDWTNTAAAPTDALHFFLYPNTRELTDAGALNLLVRDVTVDGRPASFELEGERLRVALAGGAAPGAVIHVEMAFDGVVFRLPRGAADLKHAALQQLLDMVVGGHDAKGGYGVFSVGEGIVSLALWYPILAQHEGGGWDAAPAGAVGDVSFFDVAHYEVSLRAAPGLKVAATGVETSHDVRDGVATHTFRAGGVREFTLQLSRDYAMASTTVDGVEVRSWFKESDRAVGEQVLHYAAQAMRTFGRLYGPYPYPELDVAASPLVGGAGGVEFPGLVTVARMFYGGGAPGLPVALPDSAFLRETLEFVVAHEVAHQWWNAVVGSDSKLHPFVDEALANHAAIVYFEENHGRAAADRQRALQLRLSYQIARLTGAPDRPVDLPTTAFDGMLSYAATVYAKGALFFDAARTQIGSQRFDRALADYYARYAFRIASPGQLVDALAEASDNPQSIRDLAQRWLYEAHGDEDIGGLDVGEVLSLVAGEAGPEALQGLGLDPRVLDVLQSRGVAELSRMLRSALDPDAPGGPVDERALIELATTLLKGDDTETARVLGAVARALGRNPGRGLTVEDAPRVLLDVGRELAGEDRDARLMLAAAGLLLQVLEEPAPP